MRILLDECLDWRLKRSLPEHFVQSVAERGWSGVKNGKLLALMEKEFDVFITGDRNLSYQQNLRETALIIVVLAARSTRLVDTKPLMDSVASLLRTAKPGDLLTIPI